MTNLDGRHITARRADRYASAPLGQHGSEQERSGHARRRRGSGDCLQLGPELVAECRLRSGQHLRRAHDELTQRQGELVVDAREVERLGPPVQRRRYPEIDRL